MKKYICIDDFIEKFGSRPTGEIVTFMDLVNEFKSMANKEMVPKEYIEKWFREHYGTHESPLVHDYMIECEKDKEV